MDLLERSSLLDERSGVLAEAAAAGHVVLVAGEAGIGKSALVKRFTERHAQDARFLFGACDPLLTPRALGPLLAHPGPRAAPRRRPLLLPEHDPQRPALSCNLPYLWRCIEWLGEALSAFWRRCKCEREESLECGAVFP
ncbi:AAA family ATPase [Nonomuraea sp. SYSU D8015]|uniref:AAA family ATPase n=1 Tax=Nonomuraea sp. SYSU D8015 TaxID=2593644 RepID=UPI001660EAC4|nr:AAA family ATPase [Nonomuraea sp. SYSU D8015]